MADDKRNCRARRAGEEAATGLSSHVAQVVELARLEEEGRLKVSGADWTAPEARLASCYLDDPGLRRDLINVPLHWIELVVTPALSRCRNKESKRYKQLLELRESLERLSRTAQEEPVDSLLATKDRAEKVNELVRSLKLGRGPRRDWFPIRIESPFDRAKTPEELNCLGNVVVFDPTSETNGCLRAKVVAWFAGSEAHGSELPAAEPITVPLTDGTELRQTTREPRASAITVNPLVGELGTTATADDPADSTPTVDPIAGDAYLSPAKLAKSFRVPADALRTRLNRWRKTHHDGWIENVERKPREAKWLYQVSAVRSVIDEMRPTSEATTERPAKNS